MGPSEQQDRRRPGVLARALMVLIGIYRRYVSPVLPASCRFYPTCSAYGLEAVQVHGAFKGSYLAVTRILRCHPFNDGGVDPVPPRRGSDQVATGHGATSSHGSTSHR